MLKLLVLISFFIFLQASPIPLDSDNLDASDTSIKYIFSDAFRSMVSVFRKNEDNSFYSALQDFIDLEPHELKTLLKSQGKIDFLMGKNRFSINQFTSKMQNSVLFTGTDRFSKPIFIKIFSENSQEHYYQELKVLHSSKSDILIDASHSQRARGIFESLKFLRKEKEAEPYILILKYTQGTPFSDVIHDFNVGRYLEDHPFDKSYIESIWPDFKKVSMEDFRALYSIYLKDKFRVKLGDEYYIHPELDPEKVILTPNNDMVVIDYGDLKIIPRGYREKKLLEANAQEKLIDLFEKFSKTTRSEINIEILKLKIPDEILFNPNFDSTVSQIDTGSHLDEETINSYDPSVKSIKEGKYSTPDGDFAAANHFESVHEKKKSRRRIDRSLSESKEYSTDLATLNEESSSQNPNDSHSADDSRTILAGSKKPNMISENDFAAYFEPLTSNSNYKLPKVLDDDSFLILEGDDDFEVEDLPFFGGIFKDKSFGSELTESFHSTSSTLDEPWKGSFTEEEFNPPKRHSFSTADQPRSESAISQNMKRVKSFINNRPVSPIPQNALKIDLIRTIA